MGTFKTPKILPMADAPPDKSAYDWWFSTNVEDHYSTYNEHRRKMQRVYYVKRKTARSRRIIDRGKVVPL